MQCNYDSTRVAELEGRVDKLAKIIAHLWTDTPSLGEHVQLMDRVDALEADLANTQDLLDLTCEIVDAYTSRDFFHDASDSTGNVVLLDNNGLPCILTKANEKVPVFKIVEEIDSALSYDEIASEFDGVAVYQIGRVVQFIRKVMMHNARGIDFDAEEDEFESSENFQQAVLNALKSNSVRTITPRDPELKTNLDSLIEAEKRGDGACPKWSDCKAQQDVIDAGLEDILLTEPFPCNGPTWDFVKQLEDEGPTPVIVIGEIVYDVVSWNAVKDVIEIRSTRFEANEDGSHTLRRVAELTMPISKLVNSNTPYTIV